MKFAATICLIGFVYQLGASPCGCLHENFWFLASVAVGQESTEHAAGEHRSTDHGPNDFCSSHAEIMNSGNSANDPCSSDPELPTEPALPHDEIPCDCCDLVYLTSSTVVFFEVQQWQVAKTDFSPSTLAPVRQRNVNSIERIMVVDATLLRAHLGVFQL